MRRSVSLVLALGVWAAGAASADVSPDSAPPASACQAWPCRTATTEFTLREADGVHVLHARMDPAPYVENGEILIYPGETLVFHFTPTDDGPGQPEFAGLAVGAVPHHVVGDDPNAATVRDPKTGETYTTVRTGSPLIENGTAADHLKDAPPGTMIVSLHQIDGHTDMLLSTEQNMAMAVKFDAVVSRGTPKGFTGYEHTSTCPATPLVTAVETWPYPIVAIKLSGFRFEAPGATSCA
jgi:hypothetical protein